MGGVELPLGFDLDITKCQRNSKEQKRQNEEKKM